MSEMGCNCIECQGDWPESSDTEIEEATYILKLLYMHERNQRVIMLHEADGDFNANT